MNQLNIIGRLTRDPVMKQTAAGKPVMHMTVAVDRDKQKNGESEADYFNVSVFSQFTIEYARKFLKKGYLVFVSGPVSANPFTDRNGQTKAQMSIIAARLDNLTTRSEAETIERKSGESGGSPRPAVTPGNDEPLPWDDDMLGI